MKSKGEEDSFGTFYTEINTRFPNMSTFEVNQLWTNVNKENA